ncbi:glycosyltransferase family 2 protein [Ammoniphilus oxalaticus]|uniref:glycosyltransferase family 2 protein n=1 Tax=Ammoniphilus oxalaticus TaxID=66863 RepID=UPI000E77117C
MPKFTVVIPTYNREKYIKKAIRSVLKQTYKDFECIVVDDASTDNTPKIVKSFGNRVKYVRHKKNLGGSAARNTGIAKAKGKYIAFLDSDDKFLPNKLKVVKKFIKKHPKAKFIYSWYYHSNSRGQITRLRKANKARSLNELRYLLLRRKFTIRTSTVVVRRNAFKKCGKFSEQYRHTHDWDMWLKLLTRYYGHCIPKPLSVYRQHPGMMTKQKRKVSYQTKIRKKALKKYGWTHKTLARLDKVFK